jgi:phospholipid transport system substrate-binding protein
VYRVSHQKSPSKAQCKYQVIKISIQSKIRYWNILVLVVARGKSRKNSNMLKAIVVSMLFFALAAAPSGQVADGTPKEQVKATVDQVLRIIREHPPSEDEQLQRVIARRFDFAEMAQRSLGPHWRKLTRAEQQEFVDVFTKLLKRNYLDQIKAYQNQEVLFTGERRDGEFAVVETRIVPRQGEPIAVNYRLQLSDGQWKVYDVVIENVSVVNNYRSQFNRVLARNSFSDLIRRMKEKE